MKGQINPQTIRTTEKEHKINGDAKLRGTNPKKGKAKPHQVDVLNSLGTACPRHLSPSPPWPTTPLLESSPKMKRQIKAQQANAHGPKSHREGAPLGKSGQFKHQKKWLPLTVKHWIKRMNPQWQSETARENRKRTFASIGEDSSTKSLLWKLVIKQEETSNYPAFFFFFEEIVALPQLKWEKFTEYQQTNVEKMTERGHSPFCKPVIGSGNS